MLKQIHAGKQLPGLGSGCTDVRGDFIYVMHTSFPSSTLENFNLCNRLRQMKNSFHLHTGNKRTHAVVCVSQIYFPQLLFAYKSLSIFILFLHLLCCLHAEALSKILWACLLQEFIPGHRTPHCNFSYTVFSISFCPSG